MIGRLDRNDRLLLLAVTLGTVLVMWGTHEPIGHVRDEGYYFEAATKYQGWFEQLGRDWKAGQFLEPFRDRTIVRHWEYNHEHPPIAKVSFALSHLVLHRWLGWLGATTAFRVPAFLFSALLSLALFLLARPYGRAAAVLAPVLFWAVPRHFFHGHIACFDIPVTALWCLFLVAYARAIETGKGAWTAGLVFGIALATKHNAFFLPIACVLHWLITDRRDLRAAGWRGFLARVPAPLWTMALLGPIVLYVSWPYLWHHPIERVSWWLSFHGKHVHYPWQYLGEVLRKPPFPAEYPLMLEALTVPAATFVSLCLALGVWLAKSVGTFATRVRASVGELNRTEWLVLIGAVVAIAPFMTREVPIFGGVKHWMGAVALMCVPAAALLVEAGRAVLPSRPMIAVTALALLVLAPAVVATRHFHPWGTSAYNEIAGGAAGGAALGMQRQYWSNNVTAVLPWINEHAPRNASVYFHEVNHESYRAYLEDGLIRKDIRYAWNPHDAKISAYQYHQEFRDREFEIWSDYGTRIPSLTFAIDQAPQVVVYERPAPRR